MTQSVTKLTFEEYLKYDDGTDNRYEYEDGGLLGMLPATGFHEDIISFLVFVLRLEIQRLSLQLKCRAAGTEVPTSGQGRKPDVSVITAEQAAETRYQSAILRTPPVLVVEVVSPESIKRDYVDKRREYAAIGVSEYWIIDPLKSQILILRLEGTDYNERLFADTNQIESAVFPELALTAEQVFSA